MELEALSLMILAEASKFSKPELRVGVIEKWKDCLLCSNLTSNTSLTTGTILIAGALFMIVLEYNMILISTVSNNLRF